MEHDGLVISDWEQSDFGPPRRVYELTALGRRSTEQHRLALRRSRDHLDAMLSFDPFLVASIAAPTSGQTN